MLKDKVVVITGGAGRIGSEFVKSVVENNGIAIIADINEEFANKTIEKISHDLKEKIEDFSSKILFFNLDISACNSRNCKLGSTGGTKGVGLKSGPALPKDRWNQIAK